MIHLRKSTVKGKPGREEEGKSRQERRGWGCFTVSAEGTGRGSWMNNLILNYTGVYWCKYNRKALLKLQENHQSILWRWNLSDLGAILFCSVAVDLLSCRNKEEIPLEFCRLVGGKQARKDFINSSQKDTVYKRNNIKISVASLPRLFMFLHARHIIFW